MDFLEECVRVAAPTESFWGWVLAIGGFLLVAALLWLAVQTVRSAKGWKRGLYGAFFLLPFVLAAATAGLIYAEHRLSGVAFLAALGGMVLLIPLVLAASLLRWPHSRRPLLLLVGGIVVCAAPFSYTHLVEPIVFRYFRPPYVAVVDGETHVTLTGIPNYDYAKLLRFQDAAVVQMANPDVTDATLKRLRTFERLRELDLNDSQVTDAGLAELRHCPSLQRLRVKNTKITDAGFRAHLADRESLQEIDARATDVKSKTLRDWKNQQENRKFLK